MKFSNDSFSEFSRTARFEKRNLFSMSKTIMLVWITRSRALKWATQGPLVVMFFTGEKLPFDAFKNVLFFSGCR